MQGTIEGRRDIAGGRLAGDRRAAGNSTSGQCFTSLAYSADGSLLLAGGRSKFVCIYDAEERLMLRRFQVNLFPPQTFHHLFRGMMKACGLHGSEGTAASRCRSTERSDLPCCTCIPARQLQRRSYNFCPALQSVHLPRQRGGKASYTLLSCVASWYSYKMAQAV